MSKCNRCGRPLSSNRECVNCARRSDNDDTADFGSGLVDAAVQIAVASSYDSDSGSSDCGSSDSGGSDGGGGGGGD